MCVCIYIYITHKYIQYTHILCTVNTNFLIYTKFIFLMYVFYFIYINIHVLLNLNINIHTFHT